MAPGPRRGVPVITGGYSEDCGFAPVPVREIAGSPQGMRPSGHRGCAEQRGLPGPPSRRYDSRPRWGRQSCRFLETGSLLPPLAALRLFPPLFFARAKKSRRRSGGKETRFVGFRLCRKPRPGVSSDAAVMTCQPSAGCGVLFPYRKFSAASRGSPAVVVVGNRKVCPSTPARYAHTRAVAESNCYGLARQSPR